MAIRSFVSLKNVPRPTRKRRRKVIDLAKWKKAKLQPEAPPDDDLDLAVRDLHLAVEMYRRGQATETKVREAESLVKARQRQALQLLLNSASRDAEDCYVYPLSALGLLLRQADAIYSALRRSEEVTGLAEVVDLASVRRLRCKEK